MGGAHPAPERNRGPGERQPSACPLTSPETNLHTKRQNCCGCGRGSGDRSEGAPTLPQAYLLYSHAHLKHPVFAADHKHLKPSLHLMLSKYQNRRDTSTNLLFEEFNQIPLALLKTGGRADTQQQAQGGELGALNTQPERPPKGGGRREDEAASGYFSPWATRCHYCSE